MISLHSLPVRNRRLAEILEESRGISGSVSVIGSMMAAVRFGGEEGQSCKGADINSNWIGFKLSWLLVLAKCCQLRAFCR